MSFVPVPKSEIDQTVPDGEYHVRIDRFEHKKTTQQGKPDYLSGGYTVVGTEPPAGTKLRDMFPLQQDLYWKIGQLFAAVEYTPGEQGFNSEDLIGKEFKLGVTNRTEGQYAGTAQFRYMKLEG